MWFELDFNIWYLVGVLIANGIITIYLSKFAISRYKEAISNLQDMIDKLNKGEPVPSLKKKWFI